MAYELDVAMSFWKYYKTPKFYQLMNIFDQMTETIMHYVDKAVKRLDASDKPKSDASDRSVLGNFIQNSHKSQYNVNFIFSFRKIASN